MGTPFVGDGRVSEASILREPPGSGHHRAKARKAFFATSVWYSWVAVNLAAIGGVCLSGKEAYDALVDKTVTLSFLKT